MKLLKTTGIVSALALVAFSCGGSADTVETKDAQEVAAGSGQTLSLDHSTSKVNWRGYKPTGQHYGIIPITGGELTVEGNEITAGNFTFDITALEIHDMEKSDENHTKLWNHLQSDDFFDATNYPEAKFEVTEIISYGSGNLVEDKEEFASDNTPKSASELAPDSPTHWISGNLTMRGTTKNIKFPARISVDNNAVTAHAGFNIDRTEWGLSYGDEAGVANKAADRFIYNSVSVEFDIKAN
ncbi:YceI family protein [Negadavirga shengliensis]|uniref:YceI family protein n=1 Tax=Negadavirga shengliensis TaxID=1389218 RepID=A0ABV9T0Z4_9BACT